MVTQDAVQFATPLKQASPHSHGHSSIAVRCFNRRSLWCLCSGGPCRTTFVGIKGSALANCTRRPRFRAATARQPTSAVLAQRHVKASGLYRGLQSNHSDSQIPYTHDMKGHSQGFFGDPGNYSVKAAARNQHVETCKQCMPSSLFKGWGQYGFNFLAFAVAAIRLVALGHRSLCMARTAVNSVHALMRFSCGAGSDDWKSSEEASALRSRGGAGWNVIMSTRSIWRFWLYKTL